MSDISSSDAEKPMEQPEHDLSKALGQLSVTADSSRESSPSLSDMPVDVVNLIIEKSKYKEQLILRKVSKSLRALFDKQKPACKEINIVFFKTGLIIHFDDYNVVYTNDDKLIACLGTGACVTGGDFQQSAFDDLASTLKNPKLKLDEFSIIFDACDEEDIRTYYNNLQDTLELLNHRVSIKKVALDVLSPSNLLSILPFWKPGFLENISIWLHDETGEINWGIDPTEMDQVALLDQWKQAEELELQRCFASFPMRHATHFKRFLICEEEINGEKFIRIKDFLSKLDNFELCTLSYWKFIVDPDLVYELLGVPVSSNTTEDVFHHPIPDSDYYLEFTRPKGTDDFKIVKKKRENN